MFYLPWIIAAQTAQAITEFWIDQTFPKPAGEDSPEPQPEASPEPATPDFDWNALMLEIASSDPDCPQKHPSDRWDKRAVRPRKASRRR